MEYELTYKRFRELVMKGNFPGLKCKRCGVYVVPPRGICPDCSSDDLQIVDLSGKGEVQTFTVVFVPPEGFQGPLPIAMVRLDEGPWVMGIIEGVDPLNVGMDIIGHKVTFGYKELPGDKIAPLDRLALVFQLAEKTEA